MEARSLLCLPRSFRGCLRSQLFQSSGSRRLLSSSIPSAADGPSTLRSLSGLLAKSKDDIEARAKSLESYTDNMEVHRPPEHHLHVYATKHNCHVTLSEPSHVTPRGVRRKTIITLSSGNIGFRKAARGTYDAGFQLGSYLMSRIQNQGLLTKIERLELVFRGFGPGREAFQKILLGVEGSQIRHKIIRVVDSTRLKFGGTRSRKPRRLG